MRSGWWLWVGGRHRREEGLVVLRWGGAGCRGASGRPASQCDVEARALHLCADDPAQSPSSALQSIRAVAFLPFSETESGMVSRLVWYPPSLPCVLTNTYFAFSFTLGLKLLLLLFLFNLLTPV